ncbi:uncharacterized protein LOC108915879 [Anoplophora glabripennis]|uniref:uncharacterized protein LOC108915879 n=1 Tax=Anoplophora glabripennis TaxID=217634 RepID=UPI000874B169|nr:uncharacterized protein LOC108915879 [Anoplophora glabripennis]XP_018577545.1 uncharacterized protein LOC108915879 [Anoplophora glabripennis]
MNKNNSKRIIIDVDAGTDDYLALLLLLYGERNGKVKIEAICCSMGNTSLENVVKNVVRLLETVGRTDIPVYKGANKQLILPKHPVDQFHGKDGFGDLHHDKDPDLSLVEQIPVSIALHHIISSNPNEIYLICVGPLTNLALALKLYDDLYSKIKEVWIMGGNVTAVGNVTSAAEYNFYIDPEAAYITLECLKCPIFILPWEPCLLPQIPFEWRYNVLSDKTPEMELLTRAEKKIYANNFKFWLPCDAFLVFCFLNPKKHIIKQSIHHATVELYSSYTRGQVVLDHLKNKLPNVTIVEMLDGELFKEYILKATSS